MKEKYFLWKGLKLCYYDSETSGTPILIVHANGYSALCYQFYVQELSKHNRVLALDFAGHGKSEGSLDFENWWFFRDQILGLLEAEKIESCIGLGHSLGGSCMVQAAIAAPEKFQMVLGLDPTILGFTIVFLSKFFDNPLAKGARSRRRVFKSLALVQKGFRQFPQFKNWDPAIFQNYVESCFTKLESGELQLACDPELEAKIFRNAAFRVFFRIFRFSSKAHILSIPREKGGVCPKLYGNWLSRKNGTHEHWKDSTHFFPFEEPKKTLEWIQKQLQR